MPRWPAVHSYTLFSLMISWSSGLFFTIWTTSQMIKDLFLFSAFFIPPAAVATFYDLVWIVGVIWQTNSHLCAPGPLKWPPRPPWGGHTAVRGGTFDWCYYALLSRVKQISRLRALSWGKIIKCAPWNISGFGSNVPLRHFRIWVQYAPFKQRIWLKCAPQTF